MDVINQRIILTMVSVHVLEGQQAILICPITKNIPKWYSPFGENLSYYARANDSFSQTVSIQFTVNHNMLVLDSAKVSDAGNYTCSYPGAGSGYVFLQVDVPLPGWCCICDDNSSDQTKHCSYPNICKHGGHHCEYCSTSRNFTGQGWKISRSCATKQKCLVDFYTTGNDPGCNGSLPTIGTYCSLCCADDPLFHCQDNPDGNFRITLPTVSGASLKTATSTATTESRSTTDSTTPSSPVLSGSSKVTTTSTAATVSSSTTDSTTTTTPVLLMSSKSTTTSAATVSSSITDSTTTTTPVLLGSSMSFALTSTTHSRPSVIGSKVRCETCINTNGLDCVAQSTLTCPADKPYCMNHVTSDFLGRKQVRKRCASQADCYVNYWIRSTDSRCKSISHATGELECFFCCKQASSKYLPCNHNLVPSKLADFSPKSPVTSTSTSTPDYKLPSSAKSTLTDTSSAKTMPPSTYTTLSVIYPMTTSGSKLINITSVSTNISFSAPSASYSTDRSTALANSSSTIASSVSNTNTILHSAVNSTYATPRQVSVSNTALSNSTTINIPFSGSVSLSSPKSANISGLTTRMSNNSTSRSHTTRVMLSQSPLTKNHSALVPTRANSSTKAVTASVITPSRNNTDKIPFSTGTPDLSTKYTRAMSYLTTTPASSSTPSAMNHTGTMPNSTSASASSSRTLAMNHTGTMPNATTTHASLSKTPAINHTGTMLHSTSTLALSNKKSSMNHRVTIPNSAITSTSSRRTLVPNYKKTLSYTQSTRSSSPTTLTQYHTWTMSNSTSSPASSARMHTLNQTRTTSDTSSTIVLPTMTTQNHTGAMPNSTSTQISSTVTQTVTRSRTASGTSSTLVSPSRTPTHNHSGAMAYSTSVPTSSTITPTRNQTGAMPTSTSARSSSAINYSNISSHPTTASGSLSTTKKPMATIPPIRTKCAVCAGPPEACEVAFYEDYCQPPNHYCINHITNMANGKRLVERKCGNVQSCYNEWYLGTSDDDKCRQFSSSFVMTYSFECTYCCIKDGCNVDLHPKDDTLYSNA